MLEPLWYQDAIFYELHVKAFHDSNADGIGDFRGLTERLDYLQALGITCIWLLPFYPSPLRDDGYDISWYEGIHPAYGTLRDFRTFLEEAHRRNLQVITELVVNHTSDQHPWFRAARRAPVGSPARDFYVWSDTKQRYADARIIFTDTETSNWTWDPEAGAYYWHRFFHHQPDLNFDNPDVLRAVLRVMEFWFRMGVDGMRLDAVPYLIEREGTNCENLLETHEILRRIRATLDARFPNRLLLAEANQWPADVRPYFGEGDECHMAFHFPLMPRIFMAVQQEDRHPVTEILDQTPDIPESCQWALFLRNHDELTLEMVTDEERDYMYQAYAADPRMRLNLGIRRRLAPLVQKSRRQLELLYSLLFSLPGTPVLYYGDEIGMGDNIYLGDRNGVRTPMQWTGDRNAGFSRADPAALYAPVIMDPVYGYQSVNVEAQERSPSSLLQWTRRMLALRKKHRTFGRGTLTVLPAANRKILAYVRKWESETIVVVANLARTVQPFELDLREFRGKTPVEMLGRTEFPRVGDGPYFLVLGPHAFYWFLLVEQPTSLTARLAPTPAEEASPLPALLASGVWETLFDGHVRRLIERQCLPTYLPRQRWFSGKSRTLLEARFVDWGLLRKGRDPAFLTLVEVTYADGGSELYCLPLAAASGPEGERLAESCPGSLLARITGARKGVLYDACAGASMAHELLGTMSEERRLLFKAGEAAGRRYAPLVDAQGMDSELASLPVATGGAEQSNTSILFDEQFVLKLFRRVEIGPNPDVEVGVQLTDRMRFGRAPAVVGSLRYQRPGQEALDLGVLHRFVPHQANGWAHALEEVSRCFERATSHPSEAPPLQPGISFTTLAAQEPPDVVVDAMGAYLQTAARLGQRTGELHVALASESENPAFVPEPFSTRDLVTLSTQLTESSRPVFELLAQATTQEGSTIGGDAARVLEQRNRLSARLLAPTALTDTGERIRIHGDYHLGQVLWAEGDFYLLDFEGEPDRPLTERRAKQSALKDVAGMIRSFGYAAWVGLRGFTLAHAPEQSRLTQWARLWQTWASASFLEAYLDATSGQRFLPADRAAVDVLLDAFVLEKACYELRYELNHRPDWVTIPLTGILELLER